MFWIFRFLKLLCAYVWKKGFVVLHTVPMRCTRNMRQEKKRQHEDKVDPVVEKTFKELKKHYIVFHEKFLSKIHLASLKSQDQVRLENLWWSNPSLSVSSFPLEPSRFALSLGAFLSRLYVLKPLSSSYYWWLWTSRPTLV